MKNWSGEKEDGIPRLVQLLVMAPIGIATVLLLTSSLILTGASDGRLAAVALGSAGVALAVAAGSAWIVIERSISGHLRAVATYLRAAKQGDPVESPRAPKGIMRDIVNLVEDIIQTQVQVGRYVVAAKAIEDVNQTIANFTQSAKSDHATMSRAIVALAGDLKKNASPDLDGVLGDLIGKIQGSVTTALVQTNPSLPILVEIEGMRRHVEASQADTKAIAAAIMALQSDVHTEAATTLEEMRNLVASQAPARDSRPDAILSRLQALDSGLAETRQALARPEPVPLAEDLQVHLLASFSTLHGDVTRQVTAIGQRVDQAVSALNVGPTVSRIERVTQTLDLFTKDIAVSLKDVGDAATVIGAAAGPETVADLKAAVSDIRHLCQDMTVFEAERSRLAGDDRAAHRGIQDDVVHRIDGLRPVLESLVDRIGVLSEKTDATTGALPAVVDAVGGMRYAIDSQADAVKTLSGQIHQEIEIAASRQTAQEFDRLAIHLARIDQVLDTVASHAAKGSSALDTLTDMRQALSAQSQALSAQSQAAGLHADTVGTVAAGVERALTLLTEIKAHDAAASPAMVDDLVTGFDAIKSVLVVLEERVAEMAAVSQSNLTSETATQAFDAMRDSLDRIGDKLDVIGSGTAKASEALGAVVDVHQSLTLQAETVGTVASGMGRALALLADLSANEGKPAPATAGDLVDGLAAIGSALATIDARLSETAIASGSNLTADKAVQAFEALQQSLGRIGDQIQAVEADATAKTSAVLTMIADLRHEVSAQAMQASAQTESAGTIAVGIDRALTLLSALATNEGRPVPATVGDLFEGFGAIKSYLVSIETRLEEAVAVSGSTLSADKASQAFETIRGSLDRIGDQLQAVESGAVKSSTILDTISDIRQMLTVQAEAMGAQSATIGHVSADMGAALTCLSALGMDESAPLPVTAGEFGDGIEAIMASLAKLETHVRQAVSIAGATLADTKATDSFDALRAGLDRIADQLQAVAFDAAKSAGASDTISDMRHSVSAQAHTTDIVAMGVGRALTLLVALGEDEGKPQPVTAGDLVQGLDTMRGALDALEARVDHAILVSGTTLADEKAMQAFDGLRADIERLGDQLHAVESNTAKTATALETMTDMRHAVSAQAVAADAQAETARRVATDVGQALALLTEQSTNEDHAKAAIRVDLGERFDAITSRLVAIENHVETAAVQSAASLNAGEAAQAFETLRDRMDRLGIQIHAVESGIATTSVALDTIRTANEGRPLPVTAGELSEGIGAIKADLAAIETRVDQAIVASGANLTIAQAAQAFDALQADLGRIGAQLHAVESDTAKTSATVDAILASSDGKPIPVTAGELSEGIGAIKADLAAIETRVDQAIVASGANLSIAQAAQAFDALQADLGRIGAQLHAVETGTAKTSATVDAILASSDGKPIPVTAGDLSEGIGAIKADLAAIETRVDQAIVASGANLSIAQAAQAFDALQADLGRIGAQLHAVESGTAKTSATVDAILASSDGKPIPVTAGDLSEGIGAIKANLAAIETRVDRAIMASDTNHAVDKAAQALDALQAGLGRIGVQLDGVESATAKSVAVLDAIVDVRQTIDRHAAAGETAAIGTRQALSQLTGSIETIGAASQETKADIFAAFKGVEDHLGAIAGRVGDSITLSGSRQGAEKATEEFALLRGGLDRIDQRLQGVECETAKTSTVLNGIGDLRSELGHQADAADAQAATLGAMATGIGTVATGIGTLVASIGQALALLTALTSNEGKVVPASVVDLVDGFDAIKRVLGTIETRVEQAVALSAAHLTSDSANEAFGAFREGLERIGHQLRSIEAGTAKAFVASDTVADVRQVLGAQAEMVETVVTGMGQALALLESLAANDDRPVPATLVELANGFDAIKAVLSAIEARVERAIVLSGESLTVEQAAHSFGTLQETLGGLGDRLQAVESGSAKSALILDTVADVRAAMSQQTAFNESVAADARQALAALTVSIEATGAASDAMSSSVAARFERVDDTFKVLDAHIGDAIAILGASRTADQAMQDFERQEFERLSGTLDRLDGQIRIVGADAASSAVALESIRSVPTALSDQRDAIEGVVADMRQALTILQAPPEPVTNDPPASAADLLVGLESLHGRLAAMALRVDETAVTAGSVRDAETMRAEEAQAATQRLMDAILTVRALLNTSSVPALESAPLRLALEPDGLLTRLDEVNGRLDQLSERLDGFADDVPALSRTPGLPLMQTGLERHQNGQDHFAVVFDTAMLSRIDDLATRLDGLSDLIEGMDRRQGMLEPIVTQAVAPVLDHVVKLADANEKGFVRLAGHFSQLSDTVSNVPQAAAREARALLEPLAAPLDLSDLHRRFDDLREGLDELASSVDQAGHADAASPTMRAAASMVQAGVYAGVMTRDEPPFAADATHFIGAEMDALHSRFDQLTSRIEQLADVVDGGGRPFRFSGTPEAMPNSGSPLETVSRDVLQRLDDLRSMLATVGMAELPPVVQRLETSNRTLVNVITEWRAAGSPVTREVLEGAVEGLNRQLRELGGTETIMVAINELRFGLQQVLPAPAGVGSMTKPDAVEPLAAFGGVLADFHARFDDIAARVDRLADLEGEGGTYASRRIGRSPSLSSDELEAAVAPIRQFTALAEATLVRLQAKADEPSVDRNPAMVQDTALTNAALVDVRARLDAIQARVETFVQRSETENQTLERLTTFTDSFDQEIIVARLDQSNQAIAETLLGFEARMEQPLADLRDSMMAARHLAGPALDGSTLPQTQPDSLDDDQVLGTTSLVTALKTMGGFMAAIEERFTAVETMAESVGAGGSDEPDNASLDVFNKGIVEMRRLTDEFLDISCAISGELAEHAKPQPAKMARSA